MEVACHNSALHQIFSLLLVIDLFVDFLSAKLKHPATPIKSLIMRKIFVSMLLLFALISHYLTKRFMRIKVTFQT